MQKLFTWLKTTFSQRLYVMGAVTAITLSAIVGTLYYQNSTKQERLTTKSTVKAAERHKTKQPIQDKTPEASVASVGSSSSEVSTSTQPQTSTVPKAPTSKPTPTPPVPTMATVAVGSLVVGPASSSGGSCSVPLNTTVKTNFNGGVTLYFATHETATGRRDSLSKYVLVSPGSTVPVQQTITFIIPGTYTVDVSLTVGSSSFSQAYTGPSVTYGGSTSGSASCENY